jgi:guanosine-3',5'-bis(diphosphate) 3'-pyrophosphohydrolase
MGSGKLSPLNTVWQQATAFAACQHRDQTRVDGETPYIAHPMRVALTILTLFQCDDPDVTAAALLHDVLEKTGATYDELAKQFGPRVATMVAKLSKDHRLPREKADKAYFEQLRAADWKTRLIKLADVYDNLCDAGAERDKRKKKAEQALALAIESEPPMLLARRILTGAIAAPPPDEP